MEKIISFDTGRFYHDLRTVEIGRKFWVFDQLESTNSFLKSLNPGATPNGLVCLALDQTKGRGQHYKSWSSVSGDSLTFTVCIKPKYSERLQLLLQVGALSVIEILEKRIESFGSEKLYLKWPNDIMFGDKKLGGILAESTFLGEKLERFLIGAGINVNNDLFSEEFQDIAISLRQITGITYSLEELLADFCLRFEKNLRCWEKNDYEMIKKINHLFLGFGNWNSVSVNGHLKPGFFKFLGLSEEGLPLFLDEKDTIHRVTHQQIRFTPV